MDYLQRNEHKEEQIGNVNIHAEQQEHAPVNIQNPGEQKSKTLQTWQLGVGTAELERQNSELKTYNSKKEREFTKERENSVSILRNTYKLLDENKKWYKTNFITKLFTSKKMDSDEMTAVKQAAATLDNLLCEKIDLKNEQFNAKEQLAKIKSAFDEFDANCEVYLAKKTTFSWISGSNKRHEYVRNLRDMYRKEVYNLETGIEDYESGEIQANETLDSYEILSKMTSVNAIEEEYQVQGNSQDVYRVQLENHKNGEHWYLKQNLPSVGEDLPGFLERRIAQLKQDSKIMKDNPNDFSGKIERRLDVNGADSSDVDACIELLETMQRKLESAKSDSAKDEIKKRYTAFFCHDFDKEIFGRLRESNQELKRQQDQRNIDAFRKEENQGNPEEVKFVNGYEEIERLVKSNNEGEKLGLDIKKDADILKILKRLQESEEDSQSHEKIKKLFTVTLGKEVELFGQATQRGGVEKKAVTEAENNIGTFIVSDVINKGAKMHQKKKDANDDSDPMLNVMTYSKRKMVKFKGKGNEEARVKDCTIIQEAEGEEMMELKAQAKKEGKKIRFSPEAAAQMMRLQTLDLICLQTDRHDRNYKCVCDKTGDDGTWVIKSIRSYDNDMSFGTNDLEGGNFVEKDEKTGLDVTKSNGILTPLFYDIKTDSAEYAYLASKGVFANTNFLKTIDAPRATKFEASPDSYYAKTLKRYFYKEYKTKDGVTYTKSKPDMYPNDIYLIIKGKFLDFYLKDIPKDELEKDKEDIQGEEKARVELEKVTPEKTAIYSLALKAKDRNDPSKEMSKKEREEFAKGFIDIMREMNIEHDGGKYSPEKEVEDAEEKKQRFQNIIVATYNLLALYRKYDFTTEEIQKEEKKEDGSGTGYYDYNIQWLLYSMKKYIENNCADMASEIVKKGYSGTTGLIDPKLLNTESEEKVPVDTVRVPTMLHADRAAVEGVRYMVSPEGWEITSRKLKQKNYTPEQIDAVKRRGEQYLAQIEDNARIAKEWMEKMYPQADKDKDIRFKFYLDQEDYAKLDSITDIAWNPSMTYFSTEDKQTLLRDETFKAGMGEAEYDSRMEQLSKAQQEKRFYGTGLDEYKKDMHNHKVYESPLDFKLGKEKIG